MISDRLSSRVVIVVVSILAVVGTVFFSSAAEARRGAPPPSQTFKLKSTVVVPVFRTRRVPTRRLLEEDASRQSGGLRFAQNIEVSISPSTHGSWEHLPDGGRLWRLRIHAPGATDLSLGFTTFFMPPGATLHVASEAKDYYEGPYGAQDNRPHGELWMPVVPGERAVLELYVPPGTAEEPALVLSSIGAGYRDIFGFGLRKTTALWCEINVACHQGDAWRDEIRSVATYAYTDLWGYNICTGTMIMNLYRDFSPLFLTASHCFEGLLFNDDEAARKMVVYWNFESPTCNQHGGGGSPPTQNQTGATLIDRDPERDFTLLVLNAKPDPSFGVYYSGWDASGETPRGGVGIHHPNGDEKSISIVNDPNRPDVFPIYSKTTCRSDLGTTTPDIGWQVFHWDEGITEEGSSGSGLWDINTHRLVGILSAGRKLSCPNYVSGPEDCYGKFSAAAALSRKFRQATGLETSHGPVAAKFVDGAYPYNCGDGHLGEGEQCDDGNGVNGDGCNNDCTLSAPTPTPVPTASATPTRTPTLTSSPTPTPSPTPARTPTPTPIATRTPSPTPSPLPSATPRKHTRDDYDGDGKADVAVYEAATGNWYARGSTAGLLQLLGFGGGPGGLPAPWDPDGDGITNAGFYDFVTGDLSSASLAQVTVTAPPLLQSTTQLGGIAALGEGIHVPVADYDGDGKDDLCSYNDLTGLWDVTFSSSGEVIQNMFGGPGFAAVPADYDGDGKADFATYEAATGTWKIFLTSGTERDVVFGGGTRFVPVPADYDGDGKTDLALYQKRKGKWRFRLSSTGTTSSFTGIGGTGWIATPGDFDGDGKVDAGAYRKSTGGWRYLSSSTHVNTILPTLGGPGRVPVTGLRP